MLCVEIRLAQVRATRPAAWAALQKSDDAGGREPVGVAAHPTGRGAVPVWLARGEVGAATRGSNRSRPRRRTTALPVVVEEVRQVCSGPGAAGPNIDCAALCIVAACRPAAAAGRTSASSNWAWWQRWPCAARGNTPRPGARWWMRSPGRTAGYRQLFVGLGPPFHRLLATLRPRSRAPTRGRYSGLRPPPLTPTAGDA